MTDLASERATARSLPGPAPGPADRCEPQPADPPSVFADGVELTRLLARAQLTLAQAVELSASVAAEAVRRSGPGAGGPGREPLLVGPVIIGADGRVVPGRAAGGGDGRPSAARPAGLPVGSVLADIAGAVRSRARGAGPAAEQLLAELDAAAAELPVAREAARRLRDVAAALDRTAVRAELGALVRAIGVAPPGADGTRPAGIPSATVRAAPATPASRKRTRTARRWIGVWLLSVLVFAGVVVGEVALLRDHIAGDIGMLLDAGRSGSTPSAAASPDGLPVAAPGPPAAGGVTAVDLRALAQCAPGSPCTVRLQVRLLPRADQQVVSWSYRIADRCTGATSTAPGGSVTVPEGATRAEVVGTVPLPAVPAVALFAVTGTPAAAASPPVLAGSCPAGRQAG